jgi:hypothetical protein
MSDTTFNLDQLLDGQLDDLADIPEFKPFPAGAHICIATLVDKATDPKNRVNNHPGYELNLVAKETQELANEADTPLVAGAKTSILFLLDNPIGQGNFKKVLQAVAEKFGGSTPRELIAHVNNLEILIVTKVRTNKEKTQQYTDMVEIAVL